MTSASALDIIIVNFNTREVLGDCLTALHRCPPSRPHQIVVVDNASGDGSVEFLPSTWPDVRVIALERNVGFGAANNIGARETSAPLVLFLNSDTITEPGALDILCDRLERTNSAAAGPRLIDAHARPEVSYGRMLSPMVELAQALRVRRATQSSQRSRRYIDRLTASERHVDWVSGACLLVRRDAFEAAGGFDERYFMYEEDVDLCAALRTRGGTILFTPAATIVHLRGRSPAPTVRTKPSAYDRSHLAFYEKHAPHWVPWLRLWLRIRGRL